RPRSPCMFDFTPRPIYRPRRIVDDARKFFPGPVPGSTARDEKDGTRPTLPQPAAAAPEENAPAAGHKDPALPERKVVTAAQRITTSHDASDIATSQNISDIPMSQPNGRASAATRQSWLDFKHVKSQLSLERVLEHLGLAANLKGRGRQRRGPCPVHDKEGKT